MANPNPGQPAAVIERRHAFSFSAILPWLALLFAVFLVWSTWSERGPLIVIEARDGHGIEIGDPLRYRGIHVGEVERVQLAPDLSRIELSVRLEPAAAGIARSGSRFWIVRPHLSLDSVTGLETVIGARYLAVLPTKYAAGSESRFVALPEPPIDEVLEPEGLEIVLDAPRRFSLAAGTPIHYRQIRIGTVLAVDLASDATAVEVRAYIRPDFVQLVRVNSQFWRAGGVDIGIGLLNGLRVEMDSVRSLLVGGIALATPTAAGEQARRGQRYKLSAAADEAWLTWEPSLAVGAGAVAPRAVTHEPIFARVSWKTGWLLKGSKAANGWVLGIGDLWIGPSELLPLASDAPEGAALELAGEGCALPTTHAWQLRGLAAATLEHANGDAWPVAQTRIPGEPEDCSIIGDPQRGARPLSAVRLRADGEFWLVERDETLDRAWHGAGVVARSDGRLIGVLLVDDKQSARIAPLPQELYQ